MADFVTRQIKVQAFRLGEGMPQWWSSALLSGKAELIVKQAGNRSKVSLKAADIDFATIQVNGRELRVEVGDWIVRGPDGDLGTCKPLAFNAIYEAPQ